MNRIAGWTVASAAFAACLAAPPLLHAQAAADADAPHWSPDAKEYRLQMIGNAHIDAPWLWPVSEAGAVVHSTFRSALDRMKEDPGLTMTTSSSQFYEWVEASDPGMIAEIRQRVQEGRWDLVGGWWVEPDVNMPSGEALIRQGLYGQAALERIFGRRARVGYNPDSFGHPGNLPQILKLEGMNDYVFMRPNASEKPDVTQNLFEWQGIDGTRALTFRIPVSYGSGGSARPHMEQVLTQLAGQPEKTSMDFFGVGDHGGGPTKESIASIHKIETEPGAPKIFFSTPERFFDEVSLHLPADIQVVTGDLQHHSVGCYTAGSEIKKMNRSTEAALVTSEKFAAIGSVAWGAVYPKADYTKAWQRLLLLQFHDSLAGTTLPEYFIAARDSFGRARDIAHEALYETIQRLAWEVPTTDADSTYLVVFNPHAWPVKTNVEYDISWDKKIPARAEDEMGNALPLQWVEPNSHFSIRTGLVAQVEVPAFGYRQIRIHKVDTAEPPPAGAVHAHDEVMENDHLRVTFAPNGSFALLDKDTGKEVFRNGATGGAALVMDDPSDTWSHNVRAYDKQVGVFQRQELKIEEDGPLRARVRVRSTYGASTLTTDWILYADSRKLEARVSLDWHEHLKMLKFSFPVDVAAPQATYEIGYGAIQRGTKGDEDPGQRWIDVTGTRDGSPYGLAILNDAKYGYSIDGSDMRVSIARAAVYAEHMPYKLIPGVDYQWQDQGIQNFRMELMPHTGSWQDAGVVHAAEELVDEVPVIYQGIHPGTRPQSASFLSVDAPDIVVEAVKQAEDNGDIIVRSYETAGRATTAHLDLAFAKAKWTGVYHPYEIKTIRLNARTGAIAEVNALEH
jgi:alpha-mannosidase